jgi:FKBP-type peptidyl-prolyl cis-trans isomerase SlyD
MKVEKNAVVTIDYTLTNNEGKVLDTSKGGKPLPYIHGGGGIIPGLETALEGKSQGDNVVVSVPPEQGYGVRQESLIQEVPRQYFKGAKAIELGMQFKASDGQATRLFTVVGFGEGTVKVDGNHPLAGVQLNFDVNIVSVREATKEELSHGHVHGPGGHHH